MDYSSFYNCLKKTAAADWAENLPRLVEAGFNEQRWGDIPKWRAAIDALPVIQPSGFNCSSDVISIGIPSDCRDDEKQQLKESLSLLHPWRKGPFNFFGVQIETEWRSDLKWRRLENKIADLSGRLVLDVGCGSGYHCWRMAGAGAQCVMGIDPVVLYPMQFAAAQKYINQRNIAVLPLGIDDMPNELPVFDTVFSMGLLYHRRSPFDHLLQLKNFLRPGGELVLETLIIEGQEGDVLSPSGRYAKMPNVWFIPSVPTLISWLERMQYNNIRCIDQSVTDSNEQRATEWMGFHSLLDFLNPENNTKTIEGYPAPRRAIILANKL